MAAHHTPCHFLSKHFDVLVTRPIDLELIEDFVKLTKQKQNVIFYHSMILQIMTYYTNLIACAWS